MEIAMRAHADCGDSAFEERLEAVGDARLVSGQALRELPNICG
jgi:hypothetical protein